MRGLERVARDRRALIAAQVRVSTGFTWGVCVDGEARIAGTATRRPMLVAVPKVEAPRVPARAAQLLAVLGRMNGAGPLPRTTALAELAGIEAVEVRRGLAALALAGLVREIHGESGLEIGERVVLLVETGRVLATEFAPAVWRERVRG